MMENKEFQQKIADLLPDIVLKFAQPMAKHTSFRIGGPAKVLAFPKSPEQLRQVLKVSAFLDKKYRILGAGTNVLAPDEGIEDIVICLKDCLDGMEQIDDTHIRVAAGVTMTRAAVYAAGLGLGGMEFAHGIPGTVGGGVYMNAGAYGFELKEIIKSVRYMDNDGKIAEILCEDCEFGYRKSIFEKQGYTILGATFKLNKGDATEIRAAIDDYTKRRVTKQPIEKPSAGSVFKRPEGYFAGALIEGANLKGFSIGGAQVSEKHAGFIINTGNATAKDVLDLIEHIKAVVLEKDGVVLEPEVRLVGEF